MNIIVCISRVSDGGLKLVIFPLRCYRESQCKRIKLATLIVCGLLQALVG